MTTATDLDDRTAVAWATYRDATAHAAPEDYDTAEELAWASLQADLQDIATERDRLGAAPAS